MTEKQQTTSHHMQEKMARHYDDEVEHKHDKDHMDYRAHEKSHPHTQHGGDPVGHKHTKQHHDGKSHSDNKHHHEKKRDHKLSSRTHHKKNND